MARRSAERHQQARERLERAVAALASSEGWQAWIRTRGAFRRYSLHNTILIAILAPMSRKQKDEDGNETGEVHTFFRAVSVFDVAQTVGEPLPEPPREPITGDSHAALCRSSSPARLRSATGWSMSPRAPVRSATATEAGAGSWCHRTSHRTRACAR